MMIDFAVVAQEKEQKRPFEAICQACIVRFRQSLIWKPCEQNGGKSEHLLHKN
jgi:hypothetical protein